MLDKIFGINESYVKSKEGWLNLIHPEYVEKTAKHFEYAVKNRKKLI